MSIVMERPFVLGHQWPFALGFKYSLSNDQAAVGNMDGNFQERAPCNDEEKDLIISELRSELGRLSEESEARRQLTEQLCRERFELDVRCREADRKVCSIQMKLRRVSGQKDSIGLAYHQTQQSLQCCQFEVAMLWTERQMVVAHCEEYAQRVLQEAAKVKEDAKENAARALREEQRKLNWRFACVRQEARKWKRQAQKQEADRWKDIYKLKGWCEDKMELAAEQVRAADERSVDLSRFYYATKSSIEAQCEKKLNFLNRECFAARKEAADAERLATQAQERTSMLLAEAEARYWQLHGLHAREAAAKEGLREELASKDQLEQVLSHFLGELHKDLSGLCVDPISHQRMRDPVLAPDLHTYDRQSLEEWHKINPTSPLTRLHMEISTLRCNRVVGWLAGLCDKVALTFENLWPEKAKLVTGPAWEIPQAVVKDELVHSILGRREDVALELLARPVDDFVLNWLVNLRGEKWTLLQLAMVCGLPRVAYAIAARPDFRRAPTRSSNAVLAIHLAAALGYQSVCEALLRDDGSCILTG